MLINRYNYEHNLRCHIKDEMINGQGMGEVSKLRYGLCRMSFNGCEVIAVYNALRYVGKPQPLQEIALYLERYRLLMGVFGCNMFRLDRALRRFGAKCERIGDIGDTPAFILSYWVGIPFLSPAHTVFCVREKDRIKVYNRYNNCNTVRYVSRPEDIFGRHRPLTAYSIN